MMSTYSELKKLFIASGMSQKEFVLALSLNGYETSQTSLHRMLESKGKDTPLPPKLLHAFELVKKKYELGILTDHLESSKNNKQESILKEINGIPSSLLDRSEELSQEEKQDTVIKMATIGLKPGNKKKVEDGFLDYLKLWLSKIPFASKAYALYLLIKGENDIYKIAPAIGALLYFISPIDLVPDYIPFVGFLDDGAVIAAVCMYLSIEIEPYEEQAKEMIKKMQNS